MRNGQSVSHKQFVSAWSDVERELERAGLNRPYSRLYQTEVVWCVMPQFNRMGDALGFFINSCHPWEELFGYRAGNIYIPKWVLAHFIWQQRGSLRDVIRHEYGHALIYHYPEFFGKKLGFRQTFKPTIDRDDYVSDYARTDIEEDFCETFMSWLRMGCSRNRAPEKAKKILGWSPRLRKKFRFVADVCKAISALDLEERPEVVCPETGGIVVIYDPQQGMEYECPDCAETIVFDGIVAQHNKSLIVNCPATGNFVRLAGAKAGDEFDCHECGGDIRVGENKALHTPVMKIQCPATTKPVLLHDPQPYQEYTCPYCSGDIYVIKKCAKHQ